MNRITDNTRQKKKYKRTNNDLHSTKQKTKDRAKRSTIKAGSELKCSGRVEVPAPLVAPAVLIFIIVLFNLAYI